MKNLLTSSLLGFFALACSTLPDNAPTDFVEAERALKKMDDQDVDKIMPKTTERAHSQFDTAVSLLEESRDDEGTATEDMAIVKALEAKRTADGAVLINQRLAAWDSSPNKFEDALAILESDLEGYVLASEISSPFAKLENMEVVSTVAFFNTGDANRPLSREQELGSLAEILKLEPSWNVVLTGSADKRGSEAYNKDLAMRRAQTIADQLENMGVQSSQITYQSIGESGASADVAPRMQLERNVQARLVF